MKKWKRAMALMMASAMVSGLTACGGTGKAADVKVSDSTEDKTSEGDEAKGSESSEQEGTYTVLKDDAGKPYDLGGMEITIADWYSSGDEEIPASAYEEARQEYIDWIQETYNFKIKQKAITTWGDSPEDYVNYATTGGSENYLFTLYQGTALSSAVNSGLMYDLSTLDCLDFSDSKWVPSIMELMKKGNSVYGMRGIPHQATAGIFFNKRLLEEAGIKPDSLYEMQANKEWTWAKFEELCKQVQKDTNNDGIIDQYAMTNFSSTFYPAAMASNGGGLIKKDENGRFYNTLESDETMEALNWSIDMISKYEMVYPKDSKWDYTYTAFANGEAAFTCAESYSAGDWSKMEDDFGFVCFPMGPKMDHYVNYAQDTLVVIPSCYDKEKAWKLAFAYNLYTDPVPGYEDYESWKDGYYKSFRDTESVDQTIALMINSGVPRYEQAVNGIDTGKDLYWKINKDNTPAQQAEAIRNTWQSYIDNANGKQ